MIEEGEVGCTYTNGDGTALSALLDGDGVRVTEVGAPVSATDWHNAELGDDDGSADGGSDFLAGLDAQTDVAGAVSDNDDSLKASALTGTGLLLDGLDLRGGQYVVQSISRCLMVYRTFMTSSLRPGRKKSTIWYSLIGSECR